LVLLLILFIVNGIYYKKSEKKLYVLEILLYSMYIAFVTGGELFFIIAMLTIILIVFNSIIKKIKFNINDKADILNNNQTSKTRIGFFLGVSTIIVCLIENVLLYCIN
jgi:hypothetical protein